MANEKRLIDVNALIKEWNELTKRMVSDADGEIPVDFGLVIRKLSETPTVDAVEVVRCKDCKWYKPGDLFTDIMFCHRLKKENGKPAKYNFCEDDFCSYGERRTNG